MLRWCRRILTALALPPLALVLLAWLDSVVCDTRAALRIPDDQDTIAVMYEQGSLFVGRFSGLRAPSIDLVRDVPTSRRHSAVQNLHGAWDQQRVPGGKTVTIGVPLWLLVAAFGALPTIQYIAWHRTWRRRGIGRCRECEYDLRGTTGPCPECGTVP